MNVITFKEDCPAKDNIVFCIVDNTSKYSHNKEVVKNIADWTIQNITILGYTVLVSVDEDSLLHHASTLNASHAVVLSTGTEFINSYDWFEYVEKYCLLDFFIAGHILDRGDAFYELHHQCYIINLNIYKSLGCPFIGQQELLSSHTQYSPIRSTENIHDDYTPVHVKAGGTKCNFNHKCHGWNILSIAWDNNCSTLVFDHKLRNDKIHYYPEYNSYYDQISYAHARDGFCSGVAIYLSNSETNIPVSISGPIEQLVVPASGLNWAKYLEEHKFTKDTVVKFYDYSFLTLEYMKYLVDNWNGEDYTTFALNYMKNKFKFIGGNIPYCGSTNLQDISPELWKTIKDNVRFEFHWVDLLDTTKNLDWIDQTPNTIVNLTNLFNYIGTSTFRSVRERVHCENSFIEKLQDRVPNAYAIFTRRAADGFANVQSNVAITAKDITLTDIKCLKKPTWHMNNDWS